MKSAIIVLAVLIGGSAHIGHAQPVNVDLYAWQFPTVSNVNLQSELVTMLQQEVSQILAAGHLAPLSVRYGDLTWEAYFLYQEPGRIITTLAWAFPYLTSAQQDSARLYVAEELANIDYAPWGNYPLSRTEGARREYYQQSPIWQANHWMGNFRPKLHTLYGLWLFAERAGEFDLLQPFWPDIEEFYNSEADEGRIYGSASGHIGMIRLAHEFGDSAALVAARANLLSDLTDGLSFASVEAFLQNGYNGWDAPYGPQYSTRNDSLIYHGWMFLNMSPEVGRYLRDYHLEECTARNSWATGRFYLWWLTGSQYFCRWTGDESSGVTPEMFGMVVPIERWTIGTSSGTLEQYFRSSPWGRGDCYWLEGLVQAIESTGDTLWRDMRASPGVTDLTAVPLGNDIVLRWSATGAQQYLIASSPTSDGPFTIIDSVITDSVVLSNEIQNWTARYFHVIAQP